MVEPFDLEENRQRKKEIMPSADWEVQTGKKEERISLPEQGCRAAHPPERVWSSPRLCEPMQRQAGGRAVSKGRAQPGGAAGG